MVMLRISRQSFGGRAYILTNLKALKKELTQSIPSLTLVSN